MGIYMIIFIFYTSILEMVIYNLYIRYGGILDYFIFYTSFLEMVLCNLYIKYGDILDFKIFNFFFHINGPIKSFPFQKII